MPTSLQLRVIPVLAALALSCGTLIPANAATDDAMQKRADSKASRLLDAVKLDDSTKAERVKGILSEWYITLWTWHQENDPKLTDLWTQWNQARAVVPKDEFPA